MPRGQKINCPADLRRRDIILAALPGGKDEGKDVDRAAVFSCLRKRGAR
jgi:hypothetical protein